MMIRTMTTATSTATAGATNTTSTKIPKLKIIGGASFRTFRNLWMLEELGLPYQYIPAQPHDPIVLKYNPLGKVPVLVEEQELETEVVDQGQTSASVFSMYESGPINTYLGDRFGSSSSSWQIYHPVAGTHERALYDQTLSVIVSELDSQGLWIHRKHESLGEIFQTIPEAVDHARKYFNKTNRALMKQLETSKEQQLLRCQQQSCALELEKADSSGDYYLLGSKFTAIDISYVHCLDWARAIGWDDKFRSNDVVADYLQRLKSRQAYQKVKSLRQAEQQATKSKI